MNGQKVVGLQMVQIMNEIWNPNHLRSGQNLDKLLPFCQNPFEIQTNMPRFQIVGTIAEDIAPPYENQTTWNLIFKKSGFQMVGL